MDMDRNDEQNKNFNNSNNNSSPESENKKDNISKEPHFTDVENAHASGLGSMGRSDEKVKDKDKGSGNNDVVY
jgi:hypothetical protein